MDKNMIDGYLGSQLGKKREPGVYYTTDVVKTCLRQAYLDIVSPKPFDVSTLRVFEVGRMVEDLVVRALSQGGGYSVLGTQVPARWPIPGGSIHGRVDVLAEDRVGARVVVEIKSIKNFYYLDGPKESHCAQLNFYLNALEIDRGELFYVSKEALLGGGSGGPVEKRFPVRRDVAAFEALIRRGEALHLAVSGGAVPEATPCFLCDGYCPHFECSNCRPKT